MKVLVGCEYSGIVASAFAIRGHSVTACDLEPADNYLIDGVTYIQDDVFRVASLDNFDLGVFFPPCTYLAKAQIWMLEKQPERLLKSNLAVQFVKDLYNLPIHCIAIENPIGRLTKQFRPPDQITSPHFYGDNYKKEICLWLKNLPPLLHTEMSPGKKRVSNHVNSRMSQEQKSKIKSKFFKGLAKAMAEQWSY